MLGKQIKLKKGKSDADLMQEALTQLAGQQARKARRRKWRQVTLPAWLDTRLIVAIVVILAVILADAVRRENAEFAATVTSVQGQVMWQSGAGQRMQPLVMNTQLEDDAIVSTSTGASCTLEFPDQSVIVVSQNSQFAVRLLEYHRGGRWRGRSFYLRSGELFARITPNFGKRSEFKIYTPSSVAAVRGTSLYVNHNPQKQVTSCMCGEGVVSVGGLRGYPAAVAAGTVSETSMGLAPGRPGYLQPAQMRAFALPILTRTVKPDPWYKQAELALTQTLCGPLTILGVGKASWSVGSTDFARRTAAKETLRQIRIHIEGYAKFPPYIDPATLEGLGVDEQEASRLLKNFDGRAIEKYEPLNGGQTFRITARARDTKRTRFVVDMTGVSEASDQS